jgi:chaperonin GroEL
MSSIAFKKVQSVAKEIHTRGDALSELILTTMKIASDLVGATLGPGGLPVIVERQETGMPSMVTKDGVTVYRGIGHKNPTMHVIMESARDASVRTASEAGDGTTTATVLSEALLRYTQAYRKANRKVSPQRILTTINDIFEEIMEPTLKELSKLLPLTDEAQRAVLLCSTNGDEKLATAVKQCFDITGDAGNVTILERGGPRDYEVEQLKGYTVGIGYEESCRAFANTYLNDSANTGVRLDKPCFILHFGPINSVQKLFPLMEDVQKRFEADPTNTTQNFIICATAFSDTVLMQLGSNFSQKDTPKVYPLLLPKSPFHNSEMQLLADISSLCGALIFDDVTRPLETATLADLGTPLDFFEANRYRSNIVGQADEGLTLARIEELEEQLKNPASEFEKTILKERIAKLTGGIAKLTVVGPSSAEIRERKDRAEDAVCALRGALKFGALPGATAGLLSIVLALGESLDIVKNIIKPAFEEPFRRIASNSGYTEEETEAALAAYYVSLQKSPQTVWDARSGLFVDATTSGIVDSLPAVLEAVRNSISSATLLGTLGGAIVFPRDLETERQEASDAYSYLRNTSGNQ